MAPRRPAYALVELVVVIVLVGLSIPFFMTLFSEAARTSARPDLHLVALNLAREKLEILSADKHNPSRGYAYLTAANYPDESPVSGFLMNRTVSFTDVASTDLSTVQSGSGFRKALVTVSWQNGGERAELVTVFTRH